MRPINRPNLKCAACDERATHRTYGEEFCERHAAEYEELRRLLTVIHGDTPGGGPRPKSAPPGVSPIFERHLRIMGDHQ